eukprot:GFUD01043444.1.p1 GENE.GFUD01043444.1~~GFUD01043444.1.p1  ORF type:complete len:655 (-),score=143.96 GFUD01043444.1:27-1697(-)
MGASGAGKSTLLNTLLFRNLSGLKATGVRLANNKEVTPNNLTAVSAYVQQDDLFIGTLTVKEHLTFQALVRMDSDIPYSQRMKRVDAVIQELGLSKCVDTIIGKPGQVKGISGGQMKRLAFASEVLTNPAIFFCDEPTSGLDSFMATSVVETLRTLAKQGRTVICTIHQPSSQIVQLFDKILLMAEGKTAYLGDVKMANGFFESCGFPCPINYNPADHYVQVLAVVPGEEEESRKKIGVVCETFNKSADGLELEKLSSIVPDKNENGSNKTSPYKASWGAQFKALMWRSWLSVIKEPLIVRVRILQSVVIALILGTVYFGQELTSDGVMSINGAIFLFITNTTFSNMFAVINVICMELPIFLREHFNGMYRTDVYFLTKQLAELPLFLITPVIFVGIMYYMVGLNPLIERFLIALGILELLTQVVVSFGYLISCMASSVEMALAVGPTILIPLMLFGGLFLNNNTIPIYLEWMKYFSWFMYSNEALLINQWDGIDNICPSNTAEVGNCTMTGDMVLDGLAFNKDNFTFDILMLVVLCVGFRVLAFFLLLLKTYRKK